MGFIWYGFEYSFGVEVTDLTHNELGLCWRFASKRARDEWIAQRVTNDPAKPGYRGVMRSDIAAKHVQLDAATRKVVYVPAPPPHLM